MIPPARYVNGTFARQWYTFHHENQLPPLACFPLMALSYDAETSRETILSQPFFSSNKGRYACHIRRSFPKGDSSYHTRPRPAYQELPRASARAQNNKSILERRAERAHYRTCYCKARRTRADRRARRVFRIP